ncbi:hypothetical protein AURDEDRAFT_148244 [Auricularia subglabra TFB-10046 SS5]|nr:hypothetical protein AURDEDRAFT_148244 [Auricularia subglabra TFB-10046 SS5]
MSAARRSMSSSSSSSSSEDGAMSPVSPVYGDRPRLPPPFDAPPTRSTSTAPLRTSTLGPAASKFRAIAQRVVHMQKSSAHFNRAGAGAEPGKSDPRCIAGVDPRRFTAAQLYGHMRARCDVTVIDYNSVRSSSRTFDNEGVRAWLAHPEHARPAWSRVRWIHVNGVDWDILAALAIQYDIHPLALEDILHSHSNSRSKSSYFLRHLFLRVMAHSVADSVPTEDGITDLPRSSSPDDFDGDDVDASASRPTLFGLKGRSSTSTRRRTDLESTQATFETGKHWQNPDQDLQRRAESAELRVIKQDEDRVDVALNNLFILLWRDGTVISIYAKPGADYAAPILSRLKMRDSILRSTADPSLLVQSMLDLLVDQALEVIDRYHDQLTKLEATVLVKPKMATVRSLHILSGDLALRKRSLEPIKSLIYGLRRYDRDRCDALESSAMEYGQDEPRKSAATGFMSHKAKIYLADVHDHMDYILSSVDLFTTISENLISYTFNMSGYLTNETMRILTLVTIIFLPLTLLTGYFGMNFEPFPAVNKNSDLLFWIIALPVMVVIIPLFLWSDIQRAVHYLRKTTAAKKVSSAIIAGRGRAFSSYSRSATL